MNKKQVIALFVSISALACVTGLTACGSGHNYSDEWSGDSANHYHACTDEGCDSVIDSAPHSWNNGTVEKAATCFEKGVTKYECTVCHKTKTEENIPMIAHAWGAWTVSAKNAPTAEKQGKATRSCTTSGCNAVDSTEIVLPVLTSDKYTVTNDTATCGGAGTANYSYTDDKGTVTFIAATAQLGHPYSDDWVQGTETHWRKVTCGHTEERPLEAAHGYGEPELKNNKVQYTCTVCGYVKETNPVALDIASANAVNAAGYYKVTVPADKSYTVSVSAPEYAPVTANGINQMTMKPTNTPLCKIYGAIVEYNGGYYAFNDDGVLCAVRKNAMTNLAVNGVIGSAYAAVAECEPLVLEAGEHIIKVVKNSGNVLDIFNEMKVGCTLNFEEKQESGGNTAGGSGSKADPYIAVGGTYIGTTTNEDDLESNLIGAYIHYYVYNATASGIVTFTGDEVTVLILSKISFDDTANLEHYVYPEMADSCSFNVTAGETVYFVVGNVNGGAGAYSLNVEFVAD